MHGLGTDLSLYMSFSFSPLSSLVFPNLCVVSTTFRLLLDDGMWFPDVRRKGRGFGQYFLHMC